MLVEQLPRHQDEARRAVAALERAASMKASCTGIELAVGGEALDRRHLGAVDERREIEAARHGAAVDQHRAAAAQALAAAFARAGEIEFALQHVDEIMMRLDVGRDRLAVEREADGARAVMSRVLQRLAGLLAQRAEHRLGIERQVHQPHADRVVDGVGDRRRHAEGRGLRRRPWRRTARSC